MTTTISGVSADRPSVPIGLLVRELDRLLDERLTETLARHGVSRRQWQLLSTLTRGPATDADLDAAVAPFLDRSSGERAADHLGELVGRGIVGSDGGEWTLTESGRHVVDRLAADVGSARAQTTAGISAEDYQHATATLRRMIDNLRVDGREPGRATD